MYEVTYATTRIARIAALDRETAKRSFAAYVLYDDCDRVVFDVQLSFGDEAEIAPFETEPPVAGPGDALRTWLKRRDDQTERFEPSMYEDRERALDPYLRLLATNDPWRLEGHSSLGRRLSDVAVFADLVTFDGRVTYRFDATQFLDYVRLDVLGSLDPRRPHESIRIESLVDVSALRDERLRQIASSYETIATQYRLTEKFAAGPPFDSAFGVTFDDASWLAYVAHRRSEPNRFLPPPGWTSAFPTYDGG